MSEMTVEYVSEQIQIKIELLEKGRQILEKAVRTQAQATANYDKQLAIVLIKLKNGNPLSLESLPIESPPASTCEKIAKGLCWQEKLKMEQADAEAKLAYKKMDSIVAEMLAYQSLFRHLEYNVKTNQ